MKYRQIIGIDVGKSELAVDFYHGGTHRIFHNSDSGIAQLLDWVLQHDAFLWGESLFVVDHTGLYSHKLSLALSNLGLPFSMVSGLAVCRSLGIVRGKSDPIDAKYLCEYGYMWQDKLVPYTMPSQAIRELKNLLRLRDQMVEQRAGYKTTMGEQKKAYELPEDHLLIQSQKKIIADLSAQIEIIEKQCQQLINSDQKLAQQYKWITSVKGVGQQTAWHVIVVTHGFTRFQNWRKLACYCGTAPFPYQSGTSIRGRTRVSHLADKNMKKLFNMCALSAIQHDQQIKEYYQRKIERGKHKMSVINAVRNKIIARIFAVVNRQCLFVENYQSAA